MDKKKQSPSSADQRNPKPVAPATPSSTPKKQLLSYTAQQKVEAVLSVWTERRGPSEVCKELGIAWTILNQWQERAMEGMLQALESRLNLDKGPALSPRLRQMLQKKADGTFPLRKLQQRLKGAQEASRVPQETGTQS